MHPAAWVRAEDELIDVIGEIEKAGVVMVGEEQGLKGVATADDLARFYVRVARPFVLIGEIEQSLRALVQAVVTQGVIAEKAGLILESLYEEQTADPPTELEDMTLGELVALVRDGRFWDELDGALGARRENANAKLNRCPELRNQVFHFRSELGDDDLAVLQEARDWLLIRGRAMKGGEDA